jgi:hypothetical protein
VSRSRRHSPICGVGHGSDKAYKVQSHRSFRSRERQAVLHLLDDPDEDLPLPAPKQFGDPWGGNKDGKMFIGGMLTRGVWSPITGDPERDQKWADKDVEIFEHLMRK